MERLDKERKGLDTTVLSLQARYEEALNEQVCCATYQWIADTRASSKPIW